jgi:hypothetical protein
LKLCMMGSIKSNVGIFSIFSSIKCQWAVTSAFLQENWHARLLHLNFVWCVLRGLCSFSDWWVQVVSAYLSCYIFR